MVDGVERLARTQFGLVSFAQLRALGVSVESLRWRREAGALLDVHRHVYRLPGAPETWEQRAFAATLAVPASGLSHASAAWLYRLDGFAAPPAQLELAVRRGDKHRLANVVLHRLPVDAAPLTKWRVIPVTHVPKTLVDLSSVFPEETVELALDSANRLQPGLWAPLRRYLDTLGRGHSGVKLLRELVRMRGGVGTDSALEVQVWRRLRKMRLPPLQRLVKVRDDDGHVMEIDFAWPERKVALHVDGFRWHGQRQKFDGDASQRSRLAGHGWLEVVVTARTIDERFWAEALVSALKRRAPQRVFPFGSR